MRISPSSSSVPTQIISALIGIGNGEWGMGNGEWGIGKKNYLSMPYAQCPMPNYASAGTGISR
ncbi:hypothetical protein FBB35_33705 [Nostoc sp. TCL240-02]|nr:hypothetical protein FBB35_33705 [Nostoc sp. TCL240-02]